jgi:hypothetical protein
MLEKLLWLRFFGNTVIFGLLSNHSSYFFMGVKPSFNGSMHYPPFFRMLGFDCFCINFSFPTRWSPYFFWCGGTCKNYYLSLLSCTTNVATLLWESMRMRLTFPKWGLGSLPGLPTFLSSIAWVKTPLIEAFFVSLESYWSSDVENGLAWAIWTSITQIMTTRETRSRIGNLTHDH